VAIGRIARPHGVRGVLRVTLYDPTSQTLQQTAEVVVAGQRYAVRSARALGDAPAFLVELAGVATRDDAEALRGQEVAVRREALSLAGSEYLVADLVGCATFDPKGRDLGTVREVFWSGAQDILVLDGDNMVPLVDEWVIEVDLAGRRIVVEPHDAF
jgi:16S rRNA processing protein RimM